MKKFLSGLFVLLVLFAGCILFIKLKITRGIPKLVLEEEIVKVNDLFIYGTHFNIMGDSIEDNNLDIVLYNGDFINYDIKVSDGSFSTSDKYNDGILLDDIPLGKYYIYLRSSDKDENDNPIYRYYSLKNNTSYAETIYYTFSNVGNKIIIKSDEEFQTIMLDVQKNRDNEAYDVVIDPGHGGIDSGASANGYHESELTMKIALNLKEKLEKLGVKVKLTREDGQLEKDDKLPDYGEHGRAIISHEVNAKYLFSIHLNSNAMSYVNGLEIYASNNINYNFAEILAKNITEKANIKYSTNRISKITDGVYTRVFTESDIESSIEEAKKRNRIPYDITTKSNYYFIIRETGGIMTGAYVDDRNEDVGNNPYYNSNIGTESYLLELGYISNKSDLNNIIENMDKYTSAIAETFNSVFEIDE